MVDIQDHCGTYGLENAHKRVHVNKADRKKEEELHKEQVAHEKWLHTNSIVLRNLVIKITIKKIRSNFKTNNTWKLLKTNSLPNKLDIFHDGKDDHSCDYHN